MLETSVEGVKSALKRARATIEQELGDPTQRIAPPPPASVEELALVERFARAFLADDIDGMVALVTANAWFRMPPAPHEYHGPELIGAFLAAVSEGHSGQSSRLIATRATGSPRSRPITSIRSRGWPGSAGCWWCRWRARGFLS